MQLKSLLATMLAAGVSYGTAQAAAPAAPQGVITEEVFLDIGGGTVVSDLTANAKFTNGTPDIVTYRKYFEYQGGDDITVGAPSDVFGNAGTRMAGYFYPPSTGDYIFYICSDDGGSLFLSTDDNPANKKLIAVEAGWSGNRNYTGIGGGSVATDKSSVSYAGTEWPAKDTSNGGAKITLTKGKAYYIEALEKEGGGGDGLSVAVQDPLSAIDASMPIPGEYLSSYDKQTGPLTIDTQPQSIKVNPLDPATFKVVLNGTPPYTFQWQKDGADIPDATNLVYKIARVTVADNNTKYKVKVTGPTASLTSSEAVLTVNSDTTPPTLTKVAGSASLKGFTLTFSEPLDATTAQATANYNLTGGLTVSAAALLAAPNDNTVVLTTSLQTEGAALMLTINNVKDLAGNVIAATTKEVFTDKFATGFANYSRWNYTADPGAITVLIDALTAGTMAAPDVETAVTQFGGPWGAADNYFSRVFGYFVAPFSGNYVFFVAGDDQVNLYLSTDADPANKKLIAQEGGWSNQYQWISVGSGDAASKRSDQFTGTEWPEGNTITLKAGSKYYLEILHKEGGGGDGIDATFIKEGDPDPAQSADGIFLKGNVIGSYVDVNGAKLDITTQPANAQGVAGKTATFTVVADTFSPVSTVVNFQWMKNGAVITNATASSYTTPPLTLADSNTKYSVAISIPGMSKTSSEAVLTVIADTVPAKITKVSATGADTLSVTFDETIDKTTAETLANYTLTSGLTVKTATLGGTDNNVVRLTLGGALTSGSQYTLTVTNIKDLFNNLASNLQVPFTARIVTYADVILADKPVVFYQFEETTGQMTKNYGTAGTEGDGLYKAGNGPDDSTPTDAVTEAGPRPPSFLGFGGNNNSGSFGGSAAMLWVDAQKQWLNNLGAFSLEYWVKPANRVSDPATFGTRIGIVGQNDAVEYGFIDQNTIQIWTPGGSLNTAYSFPDNEWHHVATIADGKSIKNYFDGVYVNQSLGTTANYGSSTYNVHVGGGGAFDATGNFFTGAIDEVAIFDKAIPADRIAAHFKAGKEGGELPAPEAPKFTKISMAGGKITVEWTGGGTLQAAPTIAGPWTDVPGAASPYTLTPDGTMLFGRIRQ